MSRKANLLSRLHFATSKNDTLTAWLNYCTGLALTLSSYIVLGDFRQNGPVTPKVIARKLLNAFSDQQIVEGIGIQAVGLAKINSMVSEFKKAMPQSICSIFVR